MTSAGHWPMQLPRPSRPHHPLNPTAPDSIAPRRVYDVRPRKPIWGWAVVELHLDEVDRRRRISCGGGGAICASGRKNSTSLQMVLGLVAMFFLVITGVLLVVDLKQPKRFLYVLLRPQWQSWLVRGAYIITAYGQC